MAANGNEQLGYQVVKLYTRLGEFVTDIEMLPFLHAPDGISWGARTFFKRAEKPGCYYEGMLWPASSVPANMRMRTLQETAD